MVRVAISKASNALLMFFTPVAILLGRGTRWTSPRSEHLAWTRSFSTTLRGRPGTPIVTPAATSMRTWHRPIATSTSASEWWPPNGVLGVHARGHRLLSAPRRFPRIANDVHDKFVRVSATTPPPLPPPPPPPPQVEWMHGDTAVSVGDSQPSERTRYLTERRYHP